MTTTRQIDLVINKLTKAQYEGATPNADEFYVLTDSLGITFADIINALGYTPYNATNPNGYVTALTLNNYAQKEALQTSFYSASINADGLYVDGDTGLDGNVTCYGNLTVEGTFKVGNQSLATVAFSGDFDDLTNQPTIGDGTVTITQGGTTKGTFTLNQSGNVTINLDAGGGGGSGIQNTATGTDSLTILGTATTNDYSMNIGIGSSVTEDDSIAIGQGAIVSGYDSLGIGRDVNVSGDNAIQLGNGTLSSDDTFQVWNYPLLDYQYGLIPDARLSSNIARTSQIPTVPTVNNNTITIQQNGTPVGSFTLNQNSDATINLTGGGSTYTAGSGIDITSNVISVDIIDGGNASTVYPAELNLIVGNEPRLNPLNMDIQIN